MIKEYSQNRSNAIMNFTEKYCQTPEELLSSKGFTKVLRKYISLLDKKDSLLLERIEEMLEHRSIDKLFLELFKLLIVLDKKAIIKYNKMYKEVFKHQADFIEFVEGLYNYWRGLERYAIIESKEDVKGIQNVSFIEANNNFSNLVLSVYRRIEENIMGRNHNVYRQLTAGVNAGLILTKNGTLLPEEYSKLREINVIEQVVLTPPFIIYPKKNKRSGLFQEVDQNPLEYLNINPSHYFCYPAKVGESMAFVYFHREFMNHGISLCNLFELAKPDEFKHKKPDLVYVFGARLEKQEKRTVYYQDKKNDILIGYTSNTDEIDYFGYMKKMMLTLHNVRMINRRCLPIHGAMVNITLKNGKSANIAIIGDSGAGKSESLEAFRTLSDKYLKDIKIVFDDMGTFKIENSKVYGYGTEIGAFVRLDDLEMGYSFKQMDRGIFMNPHRVNARLLLPVTTYETIMKGFKIDILLYANNYEDKQNTLEFFEDIDEAIAVFKQGKRRAKGTTTETGVVESYFANPFGPVQHQEQTDRIIDKVFHQLAENNVPIGQIYTRLAIDGFEQKGPEKAARKLFEWLQNKK
jgi:hypothetical protein